MNFVELFAGIGLFRRGLEAAPGNWRCLLANDIDIHKCTIYRAQYGVCDLIQDHIAHLTADHIPGHPDLLTGSFPCQDLSLAGNRLGLAGERSGQAQHFFRLVEELQHQNRTPHTLVLENVVGLLTSHHGADVRALLEKMNTLGYAVDLLLLDAVYWLPHSRPRIFVVGRQVEGNSMDISPEDHPARPQLVLRTLRVNRNLRWAFMNLPPLPVERLLTLQACIDVEDEAWFPSDIQARELGYIANGPHSLARLRAAQLASLADGHTRYLTGYRRMRREVTNLELRGDGVAGCLRTVTGGSSRQMLIRVTGQSVSLRFMNPREYALLMGVNAAEWQWADLPNYRHLTGFGDAVAVPVVTWLAQSMLLQQAGVVPAAMVEEPLEALRA